MHTSDDESNMFLTSSGVIRTIAVALLGLVVSFGSLTISASAQPLRFIDYSWESVLVHNRVAGFVAEHGFGHDVDYLFADTLPGTFGLLRGDLDISMETWVDNVQESWDQGIADGSIVDLGPNFPNAPQGWYIPTYVIEGDPDRGIEAMAPDLKSVDDLPKYWELFRDRENPRKGRFHNGVTGWAASEINVLSLEGYGLDQFYEVMYPGSQAALDASIARAYQRGEPWFGYYWEPTWIMGTYDMTMLEEPAYTDACWDETEGDFACGYPHVLVRIAVHHTVMDRAPGLVEFLKQYETTLDQTNEVLAVMESQGGDAEAAALWFLDEYEDLWSSWLEPDIAAKVKAAL